MYKNQLIQIISCVSKQLCTSTSNYLVESRSNRRKWIPPSLNVISESEADTPTDRKTLMDGSQFWMARLTARVRQIQAFYFLRYVRTRRQSKGQSKQCAPPSLSPKHILCSTFMSSIFSFGSQIYMSRGFATRAVWSRNSSLNTRYAWEKLTHKKRANEQKKHHHNGRRRSATQ